jgi:hypothetical protein
MTEWRDVPGYEGSYQVNARGEVRSCDRTVPMAGHTRRIRGVLLKPHADTFGHLQVRLSRNNSHREVLVHRLVALAFLKESYFENAHVCHGDGNPANNVVENLRWGTRRDNGLDRIRHGRDPHLNKTHCPQGHPYDDENTYRFVTKSGTARNCRRCSRDAQARYLARRASA